MCIRHSWSGHTAELARNHAACRTLSLDANRWDHPLSMHPAAGVPRPPLGSASARAEPPHTSPCWLAVPNMQVIEAVMLLLIQLAQLCRGWQGSAADTRAASLTHLQTPGEPAHGLSSGSARLLLELGVHARAGGPVLAEEDDAAGVLVQAVHRQGRPACAPSQHALLTATQGAARQVGRVTDKQNHCCGALVHGSDVAAESSI